MLCTTNAPLVHHWCMTGATLPNGGLKATLAGGENDIAPLVHHWCKTSGAVVQKVHRTSHLLVTGAVVHTGNAAPVVKNSPGDWHG